MRPKNFPGISLPHHTPPSITDFLHHVDAVLFNDEVNEPVRAILLVPLGADVRNNGKVDLAVTLDILPRVFQWELAHHGDNR